MTSSQHSRGRVLFEVLCIWALGGSFVAAWLQTGVTAHLASAAIAAVFGLGWSSGLFAGRAAEVAAEPAMVPVTVHAEPATAPLHTEEVADYAPPRIEIFAFEPDEVVEPEADIAPKPVKEAKPKRRKKAPAAERREEPVVAQPNVVAFEEPVVAQPNVVAFEEPVHADLHIEPLFEPQPFVRQPRAFGRKARGSPPLSAA